MAVAQGMQYAEKKRNPCWNVALKYSDVMLQETACAVQALRL